ncbi:hypothetical protein M405DRAFT_216443 [Rhizopogon salebrosus TDB-379]|nr:hypothetical protein M405DRAFT_216443 [Rhizopogon salebrosus TDB-379]
MSGFRSVFLYNIIRWWRRSSVYAVFQQAEQRGFSFGRGHRRLDIFNIAKQSGMYCFHRTALSRLCTITAALLQSDRLWWMESRIVVL